MVVPTQVTGGAPCVSRCHTESDAFPFRDFGVRTLRADDEEACKGGRAHPSLCGIGCTKLRALPETRRCAARNLSQRQETRAHLHEVTRKRRLTAYRPCGRADDVGRSRANQLVPVVINGCTLQRTTLSCAVIDDHYPYAGFAGVSKFRTRPYHPHDSHLAVVSVEKKNTEKA